jgi:hypothetical protein
MQLKNRRRWRSLLLTAVMSASCLSLAAEPSHSRKQSVDPYRLVVPSSKVVELARKLAFADFPKAQDILAIARVESRFMANARNKQSIGIMQVNYGPWDLTENMNAGVKLLREYFVLLGSEKAAITAYNCGPSNYRKGRCGDVYFNKVSEQKVEYGRYLSVSGSRSTVGSGEPDVLPGNAVGADCVCVNGDEQACGNRMEGEEGSSDPQHCDS